MKVLIQLAVIIGICLAGNAVSAVLPFAFPGSISAMVILLILLCTGLFKPEFFSDTGLWLQKNMAFFFLPANISVMEQFELISHYWLQILFICLITTILTFAAAAGAASLAVFIQHKIRSSHSTKDGGEANA
jgi:holin-like protein